MINHLHYQGELSDQDRLAARLCEAGWASEAASVRASALCRASAALEARVGREACRGASAFFVPGRIEVLGKHTDYAGGRSMVMATERGFSVVAAPRDDSTVVVIDAGTNQSTEFSLSPDLAPTVGHWSNYPMTVARRIARNFPGACRGATIALFSDLPPAAGMSSSSALMVAVFLALAEVNELSHREEFRQNIHSLTDFAGFLGTVENGQTFGSLQGDRGVGTFGGSEDHTAMLCGRTDHVSQYAYCPVRLERVIAVPPTHVFAVAVSGVVAEKTGAAMEKYNTASRLARVLVELWQEATGRPKPHLAAIAADGREALEELTAIVRRSVGDRDALLRRLNHFVVENEEIQPAAGDALAAHDWKTFGRLVDRSQRGAEELLGNQTEELSYLASTARTAGALAASAFGAGFGGSVWALIEAPNADAFLTAWAAGYRTRFPGPASKAAYFVTRPGPTALQIR